MLWDYIEEHFPYLENNQRLQYLRERRDLEFPELVKEVRRLITVEVSKTGWRQRLIELSNSQRMLHLPVPLPSTTILACGLRESSSLRVLPMP